MGAVVPASTDRRGGTLNEKQIHKTVRSGCDAGNTIKHNPLQRASSGQHKNYLVVSVFAPIDEDRLDGKSEEG